MGHRHAPAPARDLSRGGHPARSRLRRAGGEGGRGGAGGLVLHPNVRRPPRDLAGVPEGRGRREGPRGVRASAGVDRLGADPGAVLGRVRRRSAGDRHRARRGRLRLGRGDRSGARAGADQLPRGPAGTRRRLRVQGEGRVRSPARQRSDGPRRAQLRRRRRQGRPGQRPRDREGREPARRPGRGVHRASHSPRRRSGARHRPSRARDALGRPRVPRRGRGRPDRGHEPVRRGRLHARPPGGRSERGRALRRGVRALARSAALLPRAHAAGSGDPDQLLADGGRQRWAVGEHLGRAGRLEPERAERRQSPCAPGRGRRVRSVDPRHPTGLPPRSVLRRGPQRRRR